MKGFVYKNIAFANILLVNMLVNFDQLGTCLNWVPQVDSDYNACIVAHLCIISKDEYITLAILKTQI